MVQLILFVVLGALIHLLFKLKAVVKRKDFKWSVFFTKNAPGSVLTIVLGITLVLLREDIFEMFKIQMTNILAFFVGYTGDSTFKQIMKKMQTSTEKKINEKK
jgi:hypothetical protein